MKIAIIGAGMYVTGRNNTGIGVILSSLAQCSKSIPIEQVTIVATQESNDLVVKQAAQKINNTIQSKLRVSYKNLVNPLEQLEKLCLEESFNAAIICVPDHLHFPYAKMLLQLKIHTMVVKPLTSTLEDAVALEKLREQQGVYAVVEFHKRFDEANLYVKKMLHELGQLLYFTVDYSQRIVVPGSIFKGWSHQTNIFQYLGCHYVDLIYFLSSFLPVRAMAIGTKGRLMQKGIDTFDSIHAMIVWKDVGKETQMISQFSTNWIDPSCSSAMSDQKYKVIGTKGRIECDQKNRGVEVVIEEKGIEAVNPYFSQYLYNPDGDMEFTGYGHKSISRFVEDVQAICTGTAHPQDFKGKRPTFCSSLVSMAVIDAVNQSLCDNGKWVDVDTKALPTRKSS